MSTSIAATPPDVRYWRINIEALINFKFGQQSFLHGREADFPSALLYDPSRLAMTWLPLILHPLHCQTFIFNCSQACLAISLLDRTFSKTNLR
jgi:hypothetical protein